MTERDIIVNTIAQLEALRETAKAENRATKDAEIKTLLMNEIDSINAKFDEAQAALVNQRNAAIAEKTATYESTLEAFAERSVAGITQLIMEQRKFLEKLGD